MIEATCSACGTQNRIAETDVPVGAKFVTCTSCKSRVPLPGASTKPAIPTMPKLPTAPSKLPTAVPTIPAIKPLPAKPAGAKPPAVPIGPPSIPLGPAGATRVPTSGGGTGDIIDLSDLPAPKRQSPLGGAPESKPAPRSGLSAALDADLPAPKAQPRAPVGPPPASLDLDDLLGPPGAGVVDLPAPKAARPNVVDLPAPKAARPALMPSVPGGDADLPAPKPRAITKPVVAAQPISLDLDLPAPRGTAPVEISDLPAPKAGITDLLAPKATPADLLTPKPGARARELPDLLQPKPGQTPGGVIDLPAPKGSGIDLPAPKGFFDDLPQPARGQRSGPAQTDDVAPLGFFDDLPQPAKGQRSGPAQTDDVAPLGFFDDLPQAAKSQRDFPQPAPGQRPGPAPTDDIAPLGFFDDLPQPALISPPAPLEPSRMKRDSRGAIDLGDDPIEQIDLANEAPQELELEDPALAAPQLPSSAGSFDDLDLSAPSAEKGARAQALESSERPAIKIGTPTSTGGKQTERASLPSLTRPGGPGVDEPLELEEPRETQSLSQRLGPKPKAKPVDAKAPRKPVNRKVVLGILLGLAVGGGGGFIFYQRHAAAQERQNTINEELAKARKALASETPNRWTAATIAANKVLDLDKTNGAASGIAAEASFAGALADGKNIDARFATGRKKINDALAAGVTGPELDRASALGAITTNATSAITKLKALQAKAPKDVTLSLYLGWAYSAAGNYAEAITAYDAAANAPSTKVPALLGRGRVKLDQADVEGARADFNAVLGVHKDNIPAQVGLAAALPAAQTQQQESDLLAIIARKDFKDADPRARVLAYVLAGDAAHRTSRTDAARERYRKALEIDKKAIAATTSLAEVELADGKLDAAKTLVDQALVQSKNHAPALLVKAHLALVEGRTDEASAIIKELEERKPPLPTLLQVRVGVMRGKIHEAKKDDGAALDAYTAAAKLAGELDLTPTMAAIAKLAVMSKAAADAKDTAREAELKTRSDELVATVATAADKDPSLAFTLGVAYQQAGQPAQAEPWLQKVLAARPNDPDAMYQLALVMRALDRGAEALVMLEKARAAAPDRLELGIELARTYEVLGKDAEAGALYTKLLAPPAVDIPLELREHAGLFFVRTKKIAQAGEQGAELVKADKDSATGHYLVAEGLLAAGNLDEARLEFTEAVSFERTARHLDGQGRANESISMAKKDTAMQDAAIRAYDAAIKLDPTLFSSQLGLGRLYVARNEMQKAVLPLLEANKLKANDPEVAYNLGVAYQAFAVKPEEKKVALQWLLLASRLKPSADTSYAIGLMYSTEGVEDGRAAAAAFGAATHLARDANKTANTPFPRWYPEALYLYGRRSLDIDDEASARKAWEEWLGQSPPPPAGARRNEVERTLKTRLQR